MTLRALMLLAVAGMLTDEISGRLNRPDTDESREPNITPLHGFTLPLP